MAKPEWIYALHGRMLGCESIDSDHVLIYLVEVCNKELAKMDNEKLGVRLHLVSSLVKAGWYPADSSTGAWVRLAILPYRAPELDVELVFESTRRIHAALDYVL